ncbi:MAG: nuclear transport factor 2 family protein, partial [Leptolyngbya sp. RL_3_1]|nr:nuclear transport factor 2 family protein [Leptolyngbya sp. RL_3_1]
MARDLGRVGAILIFGGLLAGAAAGPVLAEPGQPTPAALVSLVDGLEQAANAQDLATVIAFYSADFSHGDGFDRNSYEAALAALWQAYPQLTYDVALVSWEATTEGGFITETVTQISGTRFERGRDYTLTAEIQSRQRVVNGQITDQEILSEQTRLVAGANPPTVVLNIPKQVSPGDRYPFDAIVQEPLGNQRLLGQVVDEGVTATDFMVPRPVDLEPLAAGGLFKIGNAPDSPDQRWISSVLVRSDGWVIDTRRLNVA